MQPFPYEYGYWWLVVLNLVLFGGFALSFLRPKTGVEWRSMGLFSGFLAALLVEMYGFPLTIYILISSVGALPVETPFRHLNGHLLGTFLGLGDAAIYTVCMLGSLLYVGGFILMWSAWKQLHQAGGQLTAGGLYSLMRHPQYTGLMLAVAGFLVQWPTIITGLMAPALFYAYRRLARREEKNLLRQYPEEYRRYRRAVPAFIPRWTDVKASWQHGLAENST